jgi:hypothetical protein
MCAGARRYLSEQGDKDLLDNRVAALDHRHAIWHLHKEDACPNVKSVH